MKASLAMASWRKLSASGGRRMNDFFFIVFHFTEQASAMVLIILISPAHIERQKPPRFLIIGDQHGAGLFRLLGGEHWMKRLSIHAAWSIYVLRTIAVNAIAVSSLNPKTELNCHDSTDVTQWTAGAIWIRVTPLVARVGRTYDLRNRPVLRILSNLSASASQSTWANDLPQPQNNLASAGRITRQERVKTPVNTTRRMWNRLEKFTDRSHRTEGDHRNGTICVAGKRCGVLTVSSCKATSHGQKGNILPGWGQWWGNGTRGQPSLPWLWQKKCVDCCQTQGDAVEEWHRSSWLEFKGRTIHWKNCLQPQNVCQASQVWW